MTLGLDTSTLQRRHPDFTKRGVLGQDEVLSKLEVRATSGEHGWAIGEVMDRADV